MFRPQAFIEPQRSGFSNALVTYASHEHGNLTTVTVSGAVGWDPADHSSIPTDLGKQADNAVASLASTLKKSGCPNGLGDIIKMNACVRARQSSHRDRDRDRDRDATAKYQL